jgi:benzoyl-CoA reductase/2-hydroxyglutaryl-CoA dehydratase subunit BcrC/BadD/HgdB
MKTGTYHLPAAFETFAEGRQTGFLKVKEIKEKGGAVAGTFCAFTPLEILTAAGVHSVSLCGMSEETIPAAERDLPQNLCPLIKSSYGFAVSDKCPYTYFADIIVGETTCDGKKKMYELLSQLKDLYVIQLPQGVDRTYALPMFRREVACFARYIQERFSVEITDKKLREAADYHNRLRKAKCRLMELQKQDPPPMSGLELYRFLEGTGFSFSPETLVDAIETFIQQVERQYAQDKGKLPTGRKRILVTGCPAGGVIDKLAGSIENNGGVVVCYENCGGIKPMRLQVDTTADNILDAIADSYMDIGCPVMSPNIHREAMLPKLVSEFRADGVIDVILQACHPYSVERRAMERLCNRHGTPYMALETDYSQVDRGQIETRIAAFIEQL